MADPSRKVRVFISYSRESDWHNERILALADRLRGDGLDVRLDQYEPAPSEGWPAWMRRQIAEADFVVVACTETYRRRYEGEETAGEGRGVRWESRLADLLLYEDDSHNTRVVPVIFGDDKKVIPTTLRSFTHFRLDGGYDDLFRLLSDQPKYPPLPPGRLRSMPPAERPSLSGAKPNADPGVSDSATTGEQIDPTHAPDPDSVAARLEAAYALREELTIAGEDTTDVESKILELRREQRQGRVLQPGEFLGDGRFRLIETIGRGGFATVWKAYDRKGAELVAVKVLHGQYARESNRRERMFRGARAMAKIQHPNVVRVVFVPEDEDGEEGIYYYVMEYVSGGNLHRAVLDGRLTTDQALDAIVSISSALEAAHDQDLIHRDVKPQNILLYESGAAALSDFDLVRANDTTGGTRTGALGTVLYAAPEQNEDAGTVDRTADIYSLGMTAIFCVYGKKLPKTAMYQRDEFLAEIPCKERLREVLQTSVVLVPADRFETMASFREALTDARRAASEPPAVNRREAHEPDGPYSFLLVLSGTDPGRLHVLDRPEMVIGRSRYSDIHVNERALSQRHCKIVRHGEQHRIFDLGSTNGTFVNDIRIHQDEIKPGDVIRTGETVFTYMSGDQARPKTSPRSTGALMLRAPQPLIAPIQKDDPKPSPSPQILQIDARPEPDTTARILWALAFFRRYWLSISLLTALGSTLGVLSYKYFKPVARAEFELRVNPHTAERAAESTKVGPFQPEETSFKGPRLVHETLKQLGETDITPEMIRGWQARLELQKVDEFTYRGSFETSTADMAIGFLDVHLELFIEGEIDRAVKMLRADVTTLKGQLSRQEDELSRANQAIVAYKQESLTDGESPEHSDAPQPEEEGRPLDSVPDTQPRSQADIVELMGSQDTAQKQYDDLLERLNAARSQLQFEAARVHAQYEVLSPPYVVTESRLKIILTRAGIGTVLGFFFGIGIAAMRDFRRHLAARIAAARR